MYLHNATVSFEYQENACFGGMFFISIKSHFHQRLSKLIGYGHTIIDPRVRSKLSLCMCFSSSTCGALDVSFVWLWSMHPSALLKYMYTISSPFNATEYLSGGKEGIGTYVRFR